MDPDPEFWPNLDPDPRVLLSILFLKSLKIVLDNFGEKVFLENLGNCWSVESLNGELLSTIYIILPMCIEFGSVSGFKALTLWK